MKILITSVGRLAKMLYETLKDEHEVRVLRRPQDPAFGSACIAGDVSRYDDVARVMDDCDLVFHTAARNNTDVDLESYEEFVSSNVDGTFNVFLAAVRLGGKRIVHSSTSMVNGFHGPTEGRSRAIRYDDDSPRRYVDIYDITKSMAEVSADYFRQKYNLSIISLRYAWLAPLEMYRDPAMVYNTLQFCFHEQDALAANLLVMDQDTVGNYLISAPSRFTDADADDLMQRPEAVLARYYPEQLDYLSSIGFKPTPIACWLDCSRAIRDLGYSPQFDFEHFVGLHQQGAF